MTTEYVGLRLLVGELGRMSPAAKQELRRGLRAAGKTVLQQAKSNASWSSRIPGAMRLATRTGAKNAGVFLRVDATRAPHARPYEGIGTRAGFFRHPVFGNRDVWVSQAQRPFLVPAAQAGRPAVVKAGEDAVKAAARAGGFR